MKDIPGAYEPQKYEDKIYADWERSGFFNPDHLKGEPYSMMMPPPNVTGVLHLGHAWENALMDTMARFQRLRGKKVLLLPGTDHAAIATQAKVEKILVEQGIKNPRQELGREKLFKKISEFAENSKKIMLMQMRKLGTSCDWSRLAYTFDEERNRAVNAVFKKMYDDGLIYRGFRPVNWSVKGQTTLSDDEIIYVERKAKFYTFKYAKDFPLTIATTRPETKLGDTAVAVNPKDRRYKKYIGKIFKINFAGQPLILKIIVDRGVDIKFGTGALGVTPAHSLVDYEMAQKNKLPIIQVIGEDGKMTKKAGKYAGLTVLEARGKVVEELRKNGLLEKEEEIDQNIGTSDRFGDILEVLPKTQWFVAVNKIISGRGKSLKDLMKESVGAGQDKVKITPKRFEKIYFQWIKNLRDWCISRQIWFGHRIPVWYKSKITNYELETTNNKKNIHIGEKPPGGGWEQDPDTLDTWFSSGLWTFSTLGWPNKTEDLKIFHPTDWIQMAYEILFFWMARMILMSTYILNEIPFRNAYMHGILRNKEGKKISKSLGNNIDPLEVMGKYGTDAVRFGLLIGTSPGQDQRFYEDKIEGTRNLVNKLWNISRYIVNAECRRQKAESNLADRWILSKFNALISEVTDDLEHYKFSQAGEKLREFTWSDFADWYLEISKIKTPASQITEKPPLRFGSVAPKTSAGKQNSKILLKILEKLLIMWHPFIPFVTEAIWGEMLGRKNLIVTNWPIKDAKYQMSDVRKTEENFEKIKNVVTKIRNLRAENKIELGKIIKIELKTKDAKLFEENSAIIEGLSKSRIQIIKSESDALRIKILIDRLDAEKNKLWIKKELQEKEKYAESLKKKLKNKEFISRAPRRIVDAEREKSAKTEEEIKNLKEQLKQLH